MRSDGRPAPDRTVTGPDAVVVGSGPNGLTAAVTLARAGLAVHVVEGAARTGGGCRTSELTLPGLRHDVCAAVHPLLALSPFFADPAFAGLRERLVEPPVPFAHPLDGGRAVAAHRSLEATAAALGADGPGYVRLLGPLVDRSDDVAAAVLAPLRSIPSRPSAVARFGRHGVRSLGRLAHRFRGEEVPALLAGAAAHAVRPLSAPVTAGFGLLLAMAAHSVGWPLLAGGSQAVTDALVDELLRLGGTVETGRWVDRVADLPPATAVVLDVGPAALPGLVGDAYPTATGGHCAATATVRASARSTGPCRTRCRGRPTCAAPRAPCTWAAPWSRWRRPRRRWPRDGIPSGPSASWSSRGWPIPAVTGRVGTPCGGTATCPAGPTAT